MDKPDLLAGLPGFRDYYPEEWKKINFILQNMRKAAHKYGYEEYEGPSIEAVDLIEAKSGSELMKEIFQLKDRNDRRLLLRPEQTPTLARMLANEQQRYKRPIRWYSLPRLFRDETIQKGRVREFWQYNIDILGEKDVGADAEIIAVGVEIIRACGLNDNQYNVYINHRGLITNYITSITDQDPTSILHLIDRRDSILQEEIKEILKSKGLTDNEASQQSLDYRRVVNAQGNFKDTLLPQLSPETIELIEEEDQIRETSILRELGTLGLNLEQSRKIYSFSKLQMPPNEFLEELKKMSMPESCIQGMEDLEKLADHLLAYDVISPVIYDAGLARGLDYYTGIVFEAFDSMGAIVRAILGGGRYDDLVEAVGGSPLSGVGFGMGETVLYELIQMYSAFPEENELAPDIYIAPIKASSVSKVIQIAERLRNEFKVLSNPFTWKVKRHLELADNNKAALVILIGPNDIEKNQISVRHVDSGEQSQISIDDNLETTLKRLVK